MYPPLDRTDDILQQDYEALFTRHASTLTYTRATIARVAEDWVHLDGMMRQIHMVPELWMAMIVLLEKAQHRAVIGCLLQEGRTMQSMPRSRPNQPNESLQPGMRATAAMLNDRG